MKHFLHHDGRHLVLGKKAAVVDPRSLKMARYSTALPAPPTVMDWSNGVTSWGMMLNDSLGDCTCAAIGHGAQVVTLNAPEGERTPPDQLIENLYCKSCGYVPGDPSTDQGGVILEVLKYVRQHALGHTVEPTTFKRKYPLLAFAEINPANYLHMRQAIQLFSTVDVGIQLPITAQSQVGGMWDIVGNPQTDPNSQPGSWGGHSVIVLGYNATGLLCITWGALQWMTWRFWSAYGDEAYALLYRAWIDRARGNAPSVIAMMEAEVAEVSG